MTPNSTHLLALAALHDGKAHANEYIARETGDAKRINELSKLAQAHRTVARLIREHLAGETESKPISDYELNQLIHDTVCNETLDKLGAPREAHGRQLSISGRLRRLLPKPDALPEERAPAFRTDEPNESAFDERP